MRLTEFLERFGSLDDGAFQAGFNHPFLLQEGKLSVEGGGPAERHVYLLRPPPGGKLIVGRTTTVEISVPDKQVSSKHAEVFEKDSRWYVTDTGSTNGTFVDGKKLTPGQAQGLTDAIPIRFGPDAAFMFLTAQSFLPIFRRLQEKAGKEDDIRPNVLDARTEAKGIPVKRVQEASGGHPRAGAGPELFLCCEGFDGMRLEVGKAVIIGRSPGHATMVLPHGEVSRAHAEVLRTDERRVTVRDLGSANGTLLCGQKIGIQPVDLPLGKALTVGPFTLHVQGPPSDAGLTVQVDAKQLKGVSGDLSKTALSDVFSEIEAEQKTGVIEVFGEGGLTGRVSYRAGQPCNARTSDRKEGIDAIKALLTLKAGRFSLKADAAAVGPQKIEKAFSDILLDDFLAS